ncbi:MAG: S49 family peptidase, partial [Chloroflexi bacterium]|nr:S49 family peptidase [Chloroflexota bacterium]
YKGLMDKLGISYETITQGKYKSIGDSARPMTEEEKQILKSQSEVIYKRFIGDVASGRHMKITEVEKLADGLAWPGSQAIGMKLVDRLGNWQDAVDRAAVLGKIEGKPEIVEYGRQSALDLIRGLFAGKSSVLTNLLSSGTGGQPLTR